MWFVDRATISVKGGDGGRGCSAYTQPPYTRSPYPDGGDGGNGGHVILLADCQIATLLDFHFRHEFKAGRGGHGGSNNKSGKRGEDLIIRVPAGTAVFDAKTNVLLVDMSQDGEKFTAALGGRGGIGNANAPDAVPERPGQEFDLRLELKLIADVGLVGFPNAGKSSLLARISTAKPTIGAYPFTTRYPVLGVVSAGGREPFVACDIPGLIEGAHEGRGLGIQFLRHIERNRLLVHVVDMAGVDGRDPVDAFNQLNRELDAYSPALSTKPQLIAANKMDLPDAKQNLERFTEAVGQQVWPISCATGEGIPPLLHAVSDALSRAGVAP